MSPRRTRHAVFGTVLVTLAAGAALAGQAGAPGTTGTPGAAPSRAVEGPVATATEAAADPAPPATPSASAARRAEARTVADEPARTRNVAVARTDAPAAARSDSEVLPRRMRGAAALRSLGDEVPAAAARSGLSAAHLRRVLATDQTAWVSETGRLFYMETVPEQATGDGATGSATPLAFPAGETFALNSRVGSRRTVFLDFDGATVTGTAWNTGDSPITPGAQPGWSLDGTPGSFTDAERAYIQEVWRQVSETYAAFDVNVTTQDPGADAYNRTSSQDLTYGTHVVITSSPTPRQQVCGSCLGVAYVGTFAEPSSAAYQPAWVFTDPLRPYDPMIVAQGAAHEVGHNLGLTHDATTANTSYYPGTEAWGPIMGSATMRAVSQFSRGEYADANNQEDDLAVISAHGLPVRPDDHGNDIGTARLLAPLPDHVADGVISTRADQDVFKIDLPCTTGLTVTVAGVGSQTTLDLSLQVLDRSGTVVAASSPTSSFSRAGVQTVPVSTGMGASATVPDASGTYFLRIDGVGNGSPGGTGWSDYASLGQYHLVATGCTTSTAEAAPTPTPSATPSATSGQAPAPVVLAAPMTVPTTAPVVRRPGAPVIGTASWGARGGTVSATARWAQGSTGGAAITKYRVRAQKRDSRNRVVRTYYTGYFAPTTRALVWRLPQGRYSFTVMAWNRVGASTWSRSSAIVTAR